MNEKALSEGTPKKTDQKGICIMSDIDGSKLYMNFIKEIFTIMKYKNFTIKHILRSSATPGIQFFTKV